MNPANGNILKRSHGHNYAHLGGDNYVILLVAFGIACDSSFSYS